MSTLNQRQIEARTRGSEKATIIYLNTNPIICILVFVLIFVVGTLWAGVAIRILAILSNSTSDRIPLWMWILGALFVTIFSYLIFRFVIKIPVTAPFSL
jgi:hypothetical protein